MTRIIRHWRIAAVSITAAFFLLRSMWIPAKAEQAQWLMERSWSEIRGGAERAPPWPWADTQPVAVLEAPGHGVRQLVLSGDSGRNLAFGPAMHGGTESRDVLISGHRDTHFTFLRNLLVGDALILERTSGMSRYEVAWIEVVDTRSQSLILDPGMDRLTLVTCYPFDALDAGGPLRYVVTALPLDSS